MTTAYRMLRETPERVSEQAVHLAPPLREHYALQYSVKVSDLPLVENGLLYASDPTEGCVAAFHEESLERVWRYRSGMPGTARAIRKGILVAWVDRDSLDLVDAQDGTRIAAIACPGGSEVALQNDLLIGQTWLDGSVLFAADPDSRTTVWQWRPASEAEISNTFCADNERVYVGTTDGLVVAVSLKDGREVWRSSVADFTWDDPLRNGETQGCGVVWGNNVVFEVRRGAVVALDRNRGERRWARRVPATVAQGYLYDRRYWLLTSMGNLVSLDPESGRVLSEEDLKRSLPRRLAGIHIRKPLLISESHVFTGSYDGYVLAFNRKDCAYAWSHRPKGAGSTDHDGSSFASANGRLYYADVSRRVYCLGETSRSGPSETG